MQTHELNDVQWCVLDLLMRARAKGIRRMNRRELENLKCWCQRCHNRYDMAERKKGMAERARLSKAAGDLFATAQPTPAVME